MNYYNYLLALENKFQAISGFVDIDKRNYETFSTEISLIFLATCSEFEVVAKKICEIYEPDFNNDIKKRKYIDDISDVIGLNCPDINDREVEIQYFDLTFQPLYNWKRGSSPSWWKDYNLVKHNRSEHYHLANLENLLNALSALSIVNHYYVWKKFCPNKRIHAASLKLNRVAAYFRIKDVQYEGPWYDVDTFDI